MGEFLEYFSGHAQSRDSYQAGALAAEEAISQIEKFDPTLVVVFASVQHELDRALMGVAKYVAASVPIIGCSTAGEYSSKLLSGSVTVTVLASPYMEVKVGLGHHVSKDYNTALHQVINSAGATEFFNVHTASDSPHITNDYSTKAFALIFMPGPVKSRPFFGSEIVSLIRRRTLNSLPLLGGCAADDCRWEKTFQFFNGKVYEDCLVMAFVKTHLKFGIATTHNFVPMEPKFIVTRAEEKHVMEINGVPAAHFFADFMGVNFGELMAGADYFLNNHPFGVKDISGSQYLVPGINITPDHGILCLQEIEEGTALRFMEPCPEQLVSSADIFLRKAILRGRITNPAAMMVFSNIHRVNSSRELVPLALKKIHQSSTKNIPISGFCSYGEVGLTEEGVTSFFNMALSGIVLGDEINEAAKTVQRNKELYQELKEIAERNQKLYNELSVVHDLGNLLNSSLKLSFVIQKTVQMVAKLLKSDGCIMFLYDAEQDNITLVSHYGLTDFPTDIDMKITLPYYALSREKNLIVGNGNQYPQYNHCLTIVEAKSAIISPVIVKNQKVGVIAVYNKKEDYYNQKDMEFLQTLINQIGIAIVNADLYEKTELLACTDGLTGLFDHNYFLKMLDRLMRRAEKKNQPLSLVMVDLDEFKYYNDKYGHTVGDEILRTTAQILRDSVRSGDIICRYGGDEFAIILVDAGHDKASRIAGRISESLASEPFSDNTAKNVFFISASLGIATYPFDAVSSKELIDAADKHMYSMKKASKNQIDFLLNEFSDLELELTPSEKALLNTIKLLIQILDTRDRYTWEHCRQVVRYATELAVRKGMPREFIAKIKLSGYLHDTGKINIGPEILNKRGLLTEEDLTVIKLHPVVGAEFLTPIKCFSDMRLIIYHHHEWFNGEGYPDGLKGEEIPLGSRILAIADGFDAMTSNRPYRKAQPFEWAVDELRRQSGKQYDPELVELFIEFLREKEVPKEVESDC